MTESAGWQVNALLSPEATLADAAGRVRVRSAGSTPADELNPFVVATLAAAGVDLTKDFPKRSQMKWSGRRMWWC